MDLEYDCKFEEMKKYIPFLESMIKRLESTSTASSNPRQAQLDKIRSLRDLLLDKKKRMKMENLLKCEQVLVNLYAKVEQRDSLPSKTEPETKPDEKDLETVRKKLKAITTTTPDNKETLPEISRASEREEICTPGSKEPALFQRRPNISSISPTRSVPQSPNKSGSQSSTKRNYTRVLVSPEPDSRRWNVDEEAKSASPLFSRRSPNRKSPKRYSPSRERKKERKKSSKSEKTKKAKGLNITLNVPEDSLDSLNTKDILSRIMNCNDNDMDIETLREAKRQILSELNQTGAKYDDISDLLLKSYKKPGNKKTSGAKSNVEVEEGELSDSESEAIESIYGGLNSTQSTLNKGKTSDDKEQPRKIQICLVINPEDSKSNEVSKEASKKPLETDVTDFQMYDEISKSSDDKSVSCRKADEAMLLKVLEDDSDERKSVDKDQEVKKCDSKETATKPANFYKPLKEQESETSEKADEKSSDEAQQPTNVNVNTEEGLLSPQKSKTAIESNSQELGNVINESKEVEIPLLHETVPTVEKPKDSVVSEIDILQALKNEILSESLSIPGSDAVTPALHQPKLTKVASAQEIAPKKRISIEKYKENTVLNSKTKTPLFLNDSSINSKEDLSKKQSLKLTMKECERFNFPVKLALDDDDDSSEVNDDDDEDNKMSTDDIYDDIAPKSPDFEDSSDILCTPPVIIPVDPVKTSGIVVSSKEDVDMRTLPLLLPNVAAKPLTSPSMNKEGTESNEIKNQKDPVQINVDKTKMPTDPRLRRDFNQPTAMDSTGILPTPERGPQPVPSPLLFPNMTPNRQPMTPLRNPSMTPSMTPNSRTFEIEENSARKHVYTPMFSSFDSRDRETSVAKEHIPSYKPDADTESRRNRWEADSRDTRKWDERDPRANSIQRDVRDKYNKYNKNQRYSIDRRESISRLECPLTPVHPFGRTDCPATPNPYGIPSLLDAPMTPVHPFGRSDCPMTPSHPFGRSDCPPTPSHPFGRSECPPTPIHPFGRTECPTTPSHPFGRSDCPATPSHPFGRSDCPSTPSHPFGRGDMPNQPYGRSDNVPRDPRLNRSSDYDKYNKHDRERGHYYRDYRDRNVHNKSYDAPESYRHHRERSTGRNEYRNDRYKYSSHDRGGQYNREHMSRREPSIGRGMSREFDNDDNYSRDRNYSHKSGNDYYYQNDTSRNSNDYAPRRGFYRERSIGRSDERPYRSSSRGPSVGRACHNEEIDNTLSVKRDAGRSFTIDTSVNSTFQDFLDTGKKMQVFDYTFDSRRQRAMSVGRSVARESSVGRTLQPDVQETLETNRMRKPSEYRRASSVGRDIVGKEERSFKDIKADFELFKSRINEGSKKSETKLVAKKGLEGDKFKNDLGNRKSRKDTIDNKKPESTSKKPYSPRKNNRDPRMRREQNDGNKTDERNRGIVYSNDNITKGTILGSGYGVKNYKIPKIKRPEKEEIVEIKEPEKKVEAVKTDARTKATKTEADKKGGSKGVDKKGITQKKKEVETKVTVETPVASKSNQDSTKIPKNKKESEKIPAKKQKEPKPTVTKKSIETPIVQNNDSSEVVEKRVTRLSRKNETVSQSIGKERKPKKAIIYDSDTDEENSQESYKKITTSALTEKDVLSNNVDDNTLDSQSADQMDSSFGIDDLEMFSDNIVSDPVIDNINALIADLDNELGPTKITTPTDFSNDMIENMLETITNPGKEDTKSLNEDEKLNDISEVINDDLNQSGVSLNLKDSSESITKILTTNDNEHKKNEKITDNKAIVNSSVDSIEKDSREKDLKSDLAENSEAVPDKILDKEIISNSDDIVTTSESDKAETIGMVEEKKDELSDIDGVSTPDSTINTSETGQITLSQESVPDSTNELQNETNSLVSSSHDPVETLQKDNTELSSSNKESISAIDSIGSILSILQNKSKIKELLSLIGDQTSDNEKIKKKLEKLSEIVSDEEDDAKDRVDEVTSKDNDAKDEVTTKDNDAKDEVAPKDNDDKDEVTTKDNDAKDEVAPKDNEAKDEVAPKDNDDKNKIAPITFETLAVPSSSKDSFDKVSNEEIDAKEQSIEEECNISNETDQTNDEITVAYNADTEKSVEENESTPDKIVPVKKVTVRKGKVRRGKFKKNAPNPAKRVTRSNFDVTKTTKKKPSRELKQLQESIKEMFMKDEILNATGIRMCRLAKLVDDKKDQKEESTPPAPTVVIEKAKEIEALEESLLTVKTGKKKPKPKSKVNPSSEPEKKVENTKLPKYKPGPKSKTKLAQKSASDPYEFDSDSISDIMNDDATDKSVVDKEDDGFDSESESLASSMSFGSSEVLSDLKKKPKRKRSAWQSGVIKSRQKRKKIETKPTEVPLNDDTLIPKNPIIPDLNCFTDKSYCFQKNVTTYSCRLCIYSGEDIVAHYKQQHPHSEIPLSRMHPQIAREAIEQCEEINFQAVSKIPTDKYVCRFCYKEFVRNKKCVLESFFWHIVSMHTGEYKKICSECVNVTKCPFNLDIPPPPKDIKGQLIGYICEKCNFTQISLENLKTHVIVRHNDEQTEVYTINLAVMSKQRLSKLASTLVKTPEAPSTSDVPRVLRSSRSNRSTTEASDDHSDDVTDSDNTNELLVPRNKRGRNLKEKIVSTVDEKIMKSPYQTKITYENDDNLSDVSHMTDSVATSIKVERDDSEEKKDETETTTDLPDEMSPLLPPSVEEPPPLVEEPTVPKSDDIFNYPHFKTTYSDAGLKEYVCCINGKDSHYKTNLLISMKRHIQTKHKDLWDGYCFVCKVIVTPQGQHDFRECFQHFLDKHMDNFPVLEKPAVVQEPEKPAEVPVSKTYINVRPLSELISKDVPVPEESDGLPILPKIESIVSLGAQTAERVASPIQYPPDTVQEPEVASLRYEEVPAEVMSKKHQVVLDSMMSAEKLINVYKCAGRYCSFTSDSAEDALLHASTHTRVGGEGSLTCCYCNFDCSGNAIDLVMHVFKSHGQCSFACGYCFYRAAAGQLVIAHIAKAHPDMANKVLQSSVAPLPASNDQTMLPREAVVRYYVCPHNCKYRTYTAQKFHEHIQQRHLNETWHSCYICSESLSSSTELVVHMKAHDMDVYQCTRCTHGADSEARLLSHAAATHPADQPQAYLRLITMKDGSKEFRVLPLASFNKTTIKVETVTPSGTKDNPTREAERSIELEKLIGHTARMLATPAAVNTPKDQEEIVEQEVTPSEPPRLATPPLTIEERSEMPTPKLKIEPEEEDKKKPCNIRSDIIYCIDSDDEDTPADTEPEPDQSQSESVIDLSDEESAAAAPKSETSYEKITRKKLFTCPVCESSFKNISGFSRHINFCLRFCFKSQTEPILCAHCKKVIVNKDDLISHYTKDHSSTPHNVCICGICNKKFYSVGNTKKHVRLVHKITKVMVQGDGSEGNEITVVAMPAGAKKPPKRKMSSGSVPGVEPLAKMKKYGPGDVDRLPINPILDGLVYCALCEFSTKVRLNMVRHLQSHAEQQPVPNSAPVNPVPHLETNEKHFDRMLNLASSSIVSRAPSALTQPTPTPIVTPELASRYPQFILDRQRYACGAPGCSYLSVDEDLFKCHWGTLHSTAHHFRCVHCSTTIPPTFAKIMDHLQTHGSELYACSGCSDHHNDRQFMETHCLDAHSDARVVVVRETAEVAPAASVAPTMDLKPWQCGLCEFRSLLRPEIVDHCGKNHQSKMQFKCPNCPFRTSTLDNVRKHMTNSHPGKGGEVFYYFYREGSIPDEDGMPRWMKQRQKSGITEATPIKTEVSDPNSRLVQLLVAPQKPVASTSTPAVDLNLVKKEVTEQTPETEDVDSLCKKYGKFCEPNGLNYKCPLCQVVMEDTSDAMQSHLYEELGYRRWVCGTCSYRAFHSAGLNEHIISEHRGQNQSPVELPPDTSIEKWVSALLDHQTAAIAKNKDSLAKQKILTERPPRPARPEETPKAASEPKAKPTMAELEKAFGPLGVPNNMVYCCPKCNVKIKDETSMRNHLESELTKIRWCCSHCSGTHQTYHEAQFHCKSAHAGLAARPREAERSPALRAAWLQAVIQVQKLSMRCLPLSGAPSPPPAAEPEPADNALLVVRYETRVPTPEASRPPPPPAAPAPPAGPPYRCPHCPYQGSTARGLNVHMHRHNDAVYTCVLCDLQGSKRSLQSHIEKTHGCTFKPEHIKRAQPADLPTDARPEPPELRLLCLVCETSVPESMSETHRHENTKPEFVKRGESVLRCNVCASLFKVMPGLRSHFVANHPGEQVTYAYYKPGESKDICCGHCDKRFPFMKNLKDHNTVHSPLALRYYIAPRQINVGVDEGETSKRKAADDIQPPAKRIAKKSTAKLPNQTVAKKSTSKLPQGEDEFSFYGSKPTPLEDYPNVTTVMSHSDDMVTDKLDEVIKINPRVVVEDVEKKASTSES